MKSNNSNLDYWGVPYFELHNSILGSEKTYLNPQYMNVYDVISVLTSKMFQDSKI